ncbi:MAG: hypothetical protein KA419_16925 [Acidobacteria bacterium]|nr:hypothetical protein [Acidobacteriota bacterium]
MKWNPGWLPKWEWNWKTKYGLCFAGILLVFVILVMVSDEPARFLGMKEKPAPAQPAGLPPKETAPTYSTPIPHYSIPAVRAVPNIRSIFNEINVAQAKHLEDAGRYGTLQELVSRQLLDERFASLVVHLNGYTFSCTPSGEMESATYEVVAVPDDSSFPTYRMGPSGDIFDTKNRLVNDLP